MRIRAIASAATLASLMCFTATSWAQLSTYSQNFESLVQADLNALDNDGWKIFGNVWNAGGGYAYGYGVFAAPNNPGAPAFSLIAAGAGGVPQGAQQLVVFNDYNNGDHSQVAWTIESNVFQEQNIGVGDDGNTWAFTFDAKLGDIGGASTALAFIKTLDPNAGFATTNFLTVDMTAIPTTWATYSIPIPITAGLVGQILQIGFSNQVITSQPSDPSGIFYDNINFAPQGTVAVEETTWSATKALYR